MPFPLLQIDAFTDKPFAGNPAAVCLLDDERDAKWMQAVAAEMNLSETAFVRRMGGGFELRWFTPAVEVDLCGHATLATAHALWEENIADPKQPISFHTRSGVLTAARNGKFIELDFPAIQIKESVSLPHLSEALGVEPIFVAKTRFDLLVEVDCEAGVQGMTPVFTELKQLPVRGVIVTSRSSDPRLDFVSRFFAPAVGIDEDPVCGSAHCVLAPFWGERLNKNEMVGNQISSRGGIVRVRLAGDRVFLGGQAVTVLRGELSSAAIADGET